MSNLFDLANENSSNMMKVVNDKIFWINQRLPSRIGCLGGVDVNYRKNKINQMNVKLEK